MDPHTPRAAAYIHGRVKWYNIKAGYGFIHNPSTGIDVFVHHEGLSKSLKKHPPEEGDAVTFTILPGKKGPEAKDVGWANHHHHHPLPPPRHSRSTATAGEGGMQAKIIACIYTAKAIAGEDHRKLRSLIPLLLRYNNLPTIHVPPQAFTTAGHTPRTRRRRLPERKNNGHQEETEGATSNNSPAAAESSESDAVTSDSEDENEAAERTPPRILPATPRKRFAAPKIVAETDDSDEADDRQHHTSYTPASAAQKEGKSSPSHEQTTAARTRPHHSQSIARENKGADHHILPQAEQKDQDGGWVTKEKCQRKKKQHTTDPLPQQTPTTSRTMRTTRATNKTTKNELQFETRICKIGDIDIKLPTPVGLNLPYLT